MNNFTPFPTMDTNRLILRQLSIEDEEEVLILRSDPSVNEFLSRPKTETIEDAREFINNINEGMNQEESVYWALELKNYNKLIGTICIWNISNKDRTAEVGYELRPQFQGKGLAQEALSKIIEFGFINMKLVALEAHTHVANKRSSKLLEKFHFESKGVNSTNNEEIIYKLTNQA